MKKVNLKSILAALALTIAFLFAGAERSSAQSTLSGTGVLAQPTGNFVGLDEAQVRLDLAITTIKENLATAIPNTPVYKALETKWFYYTSVNQALVDGKTVPESIVTPLPDLMANEKYNLNKAEIEAFKSEATSILTL